MLNVDQSENGPFVAGDQLKEPFQTVVTYSRRQHTAYARQNAKNGAQINLSAVPGELPLEDLLDSALSERSSSKASMVGEEGLEPSRLLRPTDFKSVAYTNSATRP